MAELRQRRVRLVVAQAAPPGDYGMNVFASEVTTIEDLRVRFSVTKTHGKEPNTGEITITNLNATSRAKMARDGKILLMAGYEETLDTVFVGDIRTVDHAHNGCEWDTVLKCGDGERGLRHARVNDSLRAGVKIPEVVSVVAKKLGHDLGNLSQVAPQMSGEYTQGLAMFGPARKELDRVLRDQGFEWSVQDNALLITRPGQPSIETVVLLTKTSGLVGSPSLGSPEKKGGPPTLKCRSLLQPSIRIGRRLQVEAEHVRGIFVPRKVTHTGDTAGGEWYTDVEAVVS